MKINDISLPYPVYPEGLYEALYDLIYLDVDYLENHEKLAKPLDYSRMTKEEINTALTFILRAEWFCDGTLAGAIEEGDLLEILKRMKKLYGQEEA